ncbi:MAG: hypothetical protein AAF438_11110 [Pseudomonadota bacterium]
MGAKYHTSFVLKEGAYHTGREYVGVVELASGIKNDLLADEIKDILAQNLEIDSSEVTLIHWQLLH